MHVSLHRNRLAWLGVVLLAAGLLVAACMPGTPVPPLSTTTAPPATSAPPSSNAPGITPSGLQVGVDADGNFYRGDLNAPVKFEEFSEFQ